MLLLLLIIIITIILIILLSYPMSCGTLPYGNISSDNVIICFALHRIISKLNRRREHDGDQSLERLAMPSCVVSSCKHVHSILEIPGPGPPFLLLFEFTHGYPHDSSMCCAEWQVSRAVQTLVSLFSLETAVAVIGFTWPCNNLCTPVL